MLNKVHEDKTCPSNKYIYLCTWGPKTRPIKVCPGQRVQPWTLSPLKTALVWSKIMNGRVHSSYSQCWKD